MGKKLIILSLVLLLTSIAMFGWVSIERKKETQLLQEHQKSFDNKFIVLDKFIAGEIGTRSFAKVVSTEDRQHESATKTNRRKIRSFVHHVSIWLLVMGGSLFVFQLLLYVTSFLVKCWSKMMKSFAGYLKQRRAAKTEMPTKTDIKEDKQPPQSNQRCDKQALLKADLRAKDESSSEKLNNKADKTNLLFGDKRTSMLKDVLMTGSEYPNLNAEPQNSPAQTDHKNTFPDYNENVLKLEESLRARTEDLGKQVDEFRQITKTVKEAALENSTPLNASIEELTQQVSAIREYASHQQGRIQKLQDGYDWNIIRTFCLRVIRCIDNLEKRVDSLAEQGAGAKDLEEIKDELIFALESSGIEQFEPQINSDYREQQKAIEAVKERENSKSPNLKGKIAKVIRRGYKYVIDEKNTKVVRTARVKLFG